MIQIIAGSNGKGKTRNLLDRVNREIKTTHGNIVYLDKNSKHMYELNNKIRLIDTSEFDLKNSDMFLGFISGIISQDHDLEQVYFDNFLEISRSENQDIAALIDALEVLGSKYDISFIVSISLDESKLPESVRSKVIVSL